MVNDLAVEPVAVANDLRPLVMKLARELRREVHSLGVTGGQVSLLVAVKQSPGIGVRELAAQERVSPAAMSGHVGRLERAGLLGRRPDPGDGRRQILELTEDGHRVLRSVKSRRTAWLAARLEALENEELEAVERALAPLAKLL